MVSPFDIPMNDVQPVPPISSDPPFHTWARRLLLPAFGPSAIAETTTRRCSNGPTRSSSTGHFAFGSGIHRCLGSNLARMEIRVAVETFLERIPTFALADPSAVRWNGGQVRGPRCVPIRS